MVSRLSLVPCVFSVSVVNRHEVTVASDCFRCSSLSSPRQTLQYSAVDARGGASSRLSESLPTTPDASFGQTDRHGGMGISPGDSMRGADSISAGRGAGVCGGGKTKPLLSGSLVRAVSYGLVNGILLAPVSVRYELSFAVIRCVSPSGLSYFFVYCWINFPPEHPRPIARQLRYEDEHAPYLLV